MQFIINEREMEAMKKAMEVVKYLDDQVSTANCTCTTCGKVRECELILNIKDMLKEEAG